MPKLTLSFKGHILSVHSLAEADLVIGREPELDLPIDSLAVGPRHALVGTLEGRQFIRALDPAFPVLVNNKPVQESPLSHGDRIQIGKHTLLFSSDAMSLVSSDEPPDADWPLPQPGATVEPEPLTAFLQVLDGEHLGRVIPLTRGLVRIGKAGGDCAMIAQRDNGHYISCLEGSVPRVDGTPIGDETRMLADGDQIQIGETRFRFYLEPHRSNS